VLLTGTDGSVLPLGTAPMCQLSLALRDERFCYCSAISTCGKWLAYSDQKSSRLFQLSQVVCIGLVELPYDACMVQNISVISLIAVNLLGLA